MEIHKVKNLNVIKTISKLSIITTTKPLLLPIVILVLFLIVLNSNEKVLADHPVNAISFKVQVPNAGNVQENKHIITT